MSEPDLPSERTRARERLSALMDGEADRELIAAVCSQWRQDEDDRAQWHAYHLIGDVLRSEDLGRRSTGDAAFLAGVRERLAREPVVLAPLARPQDDAAGIEARPAVAVGQRRGVVDLPVRRSPMLRMRRWAAPVGMAAGVALVAGAVLVTRPGALPGNELVQTSPVPASAAVLANATQPVQVSGPSTAEGDNADMIRYVNAHQQYHGGAILAPAAGYLRSTSYEPVPAR